MYVISNKEIGYNWNSWNQTQNTFNLKVYDDDCKYPKNLIVRGWNWIKQELDALHVDISFFQYVRVTKEDCTWQLDFFDNPDEKGRSFCLFNIYYDSKSKKILQAEFGIGQ